MFRVILVIAVCVVLGLSYERGPSDEQIALAAFCATPSAKLKIACINHREQ